MTELWDLIVQSNTFNFAILVIIFAIIFVKLDFGTVVEKIKKDVIEAIETAKKERDLAKKELKEAKGKVKNLDSEIKERIDTASKNAQTIAKQILNDNKSKIQQIENNANKIINAEERNLSADLTSKTIQSSVELAKKHIKGLLQENEDLHDKYIDKSLNEIDKVNF